MIGLPLRDIKAAITVLETVFLCVLKMKSKKWTWADEQIISDLELMTGRRVKQKKTQL